jgi:hypothetical protein
MTHNYFDRVTTIPNRLTTISRFTKLFKDKKVRIITSVLSAYLVIIVGGLHFFNVAQNTNIANANPPENTAGIIASLSSLVPIDSTKKTGETIEMTLELQNTSSVDVLSEVQIDMYSTKETINWAKTVVKKNTINSTDNHSFNLPDIFQSEKTRYTISGKLANEDTQNIAIMARVKYTVKDSAKEITTNRTFVSIDGSVKIEQNATLKTNKLEYKSAEKPFFIVAKPTNVQEEWLGQVVIFDKHTGNIVDSMACNIPQNTEQNTCQVEAPNLAGGQYKAVFMINDMEKSNAIDFGVGGKSVIQVFEKFRVRK